MLEEGLQRRVYLACGATDLRKGIDGLSVLVKEGFELDPFSTSLFVFCNRKKDKIKCLYWDHNGFWLVQRRLERGRFDWPQDEKEVMGISYRQLRWLLDGLSPFQTKAHRAVKNRTII